MATKVTQLSANAVPGTPRIFLNKILGVRDTKNTDAYELGVNIGMSWRMGSTWPSISRQY